MVEDYHYADASLFARYRALSLPLNDHSGIAHHYGIERQERLKSLKQGHLIYRSITPQLPDHRYRKRVLPAFECDPHRAL
jgi:hypothetical protein